MKQKLNILFLCGWYPSRVLPTNGDFIQRHAEAVATKHNVTVLHLVTDEKINAVERTSETINSLKTIIVYIPKTWNPIYKIWLLFYHYYIELKKLEKTDIIHLNITFPIGIIALFYSYLKKIPYIISEHWSDYQYPINKSISFFEKLITKQIIKNASFVCPVTNHLKLHMLNYGLNGKYLPIPNVVDTSIFKPSSIDLKKNFTITHVSGMTDSIKNVTGIIKAIEKIQNQIPNLEVNLIGKNSKQYQPEIEKRKINCIKLIDNISHKQVAEYLKKTDVFVLFSNYENLPCVILEAFACGVPVVSTNVGGIGEYFPNNFGYLINVNDVNSLVNSVIKIYKNELNVNKEEIHKYAKENFGIKAISNSFSNLYFEALNLKSS